MNGAEKFAAGRAAPPANSADAIRGLKPFVPPTEYPPSPNAGGGEWTPGRGTKTLRQDISRWYDNAGGLDPAVESAQKSLGARQAADAATEKAAPWSLENAMGLTPKNPFLGWDPKGLDLEIPTTVRERDDPLNGENMGQYAGYSYANMPKTGKGPRISLNPHAPGRQHTLEHERSHALYMGALQKMQSTNPAGTRATSPLATESSNGRLPSEAAYLTRATEIDVRLAGIKRIYAHFTGELVDTPEKAEKALQWYGENYRQADEDKKDRPRFGGWSGSKDFLLDGQDGIQEDDYFASREWLSLPPEKRKQVLQRMTEVVSNGRPSAPTA